jgi:hypothetical protein
MRIRFSFLPTFFTVLTVAFVVVAAVRIRSLSGTDTHLIHAAAPAPAPVRAAGGGGATYVPQSAPGDATVPSAIVADDPATASSPEDRRRIAEREQRYNELLKSPPPAGVPAPSLVGQAHPQQAPVHSVKPPAPQPGLLSRIGSAIVKAVTGNGSSSSSSTPMTSGQAPPGMTETTGDKSKEKDPIKDPNSDTTPPTLLTVEFNPTLIHDGEDITLAITAQDDISGVRTISGNVVSPSGSLQGFALQREGDTNRFVARLTIPKSAAEGMWHINYLNLTDNASNSVTLSYNQGMLPPSASFRVQSANSDDKPPTLKAVWLDRVQMKAGDRNTVFVSADDDKSGVNLVSGVFLSPSKFARIGFGCRAQDNSTTWTCDVMPPADVDCGDWQLEQIQLQDKAGNIAASRSDNPLIANVKLSIISNGCDSKPPVVQQVILDATRVNAPGLVNITVQATDDQSGVASISGHFVYTGKVTGANQPPRLYFSCRPVGDAPATTWTGPLAIPDKEAKGLWRLGALQVLDKANNLRLYSTNDPVTANVTFVIQ